MLKISKKLLAAAFLTIAIAVIAAAWLLTLTSTPAQAVETFNHPTGYNQETDSCGECHRAHSATATDLTFCESCHSYPAGKDQGTYQGSKTHKVHVETYNFACSNCHYDLNNHNDSGVTSKDDWAQKFDRSKVDIVFNPVLNPPPATVYDFNQNKRCANLYCHGQQGTVNGLDFSLLGGTNQPVFGTNIPTWDNPYANDYDTTKVTGACGTCHDTFKDNSAIEGFPGWGSSDWSSLPGTVFDVTPLTSIGAVLNDSHTGHLDAEDGPRALCNTCHPAPPNVGVTSPSPSMHVNNYFNISGTGGGACIACHGHDAGYEYEPSKLSAGKGTFKSHSTHTENDDDDFRGPNIQCGTCHNTSAFPYFRTEANPNAKVTLSQTDICNDCHSPGGDYDGVNNNEIGAKKNWSEPASDESKIYTSDEQLRSGKEKWCAGCHDKLPSVIQSVSAPNVIGDETGSYTYGTGWGFYKTGHGLPADQAYPSKNGFYPPLTVNGSTRAVECSSCHDFTAKHTDGVDRTYGTESLAQGYYRNGYRLKQVSGQEPLKVPKPYGENAYSDYLLCFQCHNSGPFIDPNDERSNMAQRNTGNWDEKVGHQYHLSLPNANTTWTSDWRATGNSGVSCPQCHNVHGSKNYAMLSDGSLTGTVPGFEFYYYNRALSTFDYSNAGQYVPPTPTNMPLRLADGFSWFPVSTNTVGCTATCHSQELRRDFEWTPYNVPNQAPVLNYTGETNYVFDSVYPKSGVSGSNFLFRVKYRDYLQDMNGNGFFNTPSYIKVMIDNDNNGVYETSYPMEAEGGSTLDGRIYKKTIALTNTYSSVLRYRVEASDGFLSGLNAVGDPANEGTVLIINRAPVLTWTNETQYESDGVYPNAGGAGQNFAFRLNYTDLDDHAPDANGVRLIINGQEYSMEEKPGGYYNTGKIFYKTMQLNTIGTLNYRFVANDSFGASATGIPVTDQTLSVLPLSIPPSLDWVAETGRTEGVKPGFGPAGTNFEFRVKYTDLSNQWPPFSGYMRVWIDKNDNDSTDAGETLDMQEEVPGAGSASGKLYKVSARLLRAGDGILKYRFLASNGVDIAGGEAATDRYLTVTNSKIWTSDTDFTGLNLTNVGITGTGADAYASLHKGAENWFITNATGNIPATTWGDMVYDSRRKKFVYYDGNTREYDPALNQWTLISTVNSPPTNAAGYGWLGASHMTYDPDRGKVVMFSYNGQTWEYDSTNGWVNRNPQFINKIDTSRFKEALVYNTNLRKVVLVGGAANPGVTYAYSGFTLYDESWMYDPLRNSWEPVLFNNTNPPASKGFFSSKEDQTIAFFDQYNDKVVIPAGGGYSYNDPASTFKFGAGDWLWSSQAANTPNRMYQTALAYDSDNNRAILYGGSKDDVGQTQTWAYNSTSSTWQQLTTVNTPPGGGGPMAYDSLNKRMIFIGGGTWSFGNNYSPSNPGTISGLIADAGEGNTAGWNSISWDAVEPFGASIKFQVRTGNSLAELNNAVFKGPDGIEGAFFTASPNPLNGFADSRFVEAKVFLETTKRFSSPFMKSVTVEYDVN